MVLREITVSVLNKSNHIIYGADSFCKPCKSGSCVSQHDIFATVKNTPKFKFMEDFLIGAAVGLASYVLLLAFGHFKAKQKDNQKDWQEVSHDKKDGNV